MASSSGGGSSSSGGGGGSSSGGGGSYGGGGGYGGGPVKFYGVVIHDSIKRGNRDELQKLLTAAKQQHEEQGDLGKAIKELEAALAKK